MCERGVASSHFNLTFLIFSSLSLSKVTNSLSHSKTNVYKHTLGLDCVVLINLQVVSRAMVTF